MTERKNQEGYVLILAILVLVVLAGIGTFALRTTRTDLRATGNVRMGAIAEYVAEAALQQAVAQILSAPGVYVQQMEQNNGVFTIGHDGTLFGEANESTYDALGLKTSLVPSFSVQLSRLLDVSPSLMSGYSIGGSTSGAGNTRFRLKRLDLTSTSTLNPRSAAGPIDNRTAASQVRAMLVIGPL